MPKDDFPSTPAVHFLRSRTIPFIAHQFTWKEHGGTGHASQVLDVPEHEVVKTLVMQTDPRHPLLVLMHGDREVSTHASWQRVLGVKHVEPCPPVAAQKHTGYLVGGISPFGTRSQMPVCVQSTIFALPRMFVNGGKRGFLVEIAPTDLRKAFPELLEADVATNA